MFVKKCEALTAHMVRPSLSLSLSRWPPQGLTHTCWPALTARHGPRARRRRRTAARAARRRADAAGPRDERDGRRGRARRVGVRQRVQEGARWASLSFLPSPLALALALGGHCVRGVPDVRADSSGRARTQLSSAELAAPIERRDSTPLHSPAITNGHAHAHTQGNGSGLAASQRTSTDSATPSVSGGGGFESPVVGGAPKGTEDWGGDLMDVNDDDGDWGASRLLLSSFLLARSGSSPLSFPSRSPPHERPLATPSSRRRVRVRRRPSRARRPPRRAPLVVVLARQARPRRRRAEGRLPPPRRRVAQLGAARPARHGRGRQLGPR